ncbi:hypothetical protein ACIBEJ_48770 [Nonomuraea sp. NPDC050790]|uniref:hypothetical protein n=1 Tax=Nonomuraea sp. NPDC050790 TaxID=3364371 RepID=UPI0037A481E6
MNTPLEADIVRMCIDLLRARNNEDEVGQRINGMLATFHPTMHAALLKVVLRVVIAQFHAPTARRLDHEIGWEFCQAGLDLQEASTNGTLEADGDDWPHLAVVHDPNVPLYGPGEP